jgi:hypothetical protein
VSELVDPRPWSIQWNPKAPQESEPHSFNRLQVNIFTVAWEIISAYGGVGTSMGFRDLQTASGFTILGKVMIMLTMGMGKMRWDLTSRSQGRRFAEAAAWKLILDHSATVYVSSCFEGMCRATLDFEIWSIDDSHDTSWSPDVGTLRRGMPINTDIAIDFSYQTITNALRNYAVAMMVQNYEHQRSAP